MADLNHAHEGQTFLHCRHCLDQFLGSPAHAEKSPAEAMAYQASAYPLTLPDGTTTQIFVLWCKHCKRQVWDSRHLYPIGQLLDELATIREGIETDRFTLENVTALEKKLRGL